MMAPTSDAAADIALLIDAPSRGRYAFEPEREVDLYGRLRLGAFDRTRQMLERVNRQRRAAGAEAFTAGELTALGTLEAVHRALVGRFSREHNPQFAQQALDHLADQLGGEGASSLTERFIERFPPLTVARGDLTPAEYLAASHTPKRRLVADLISVWLFNSNPAAAKYRELYDDAELRRLTRYRDAIEGLRSFFRGQPTMGPARLSLIDLLESYIHHAPHSLADQLAYVRMQWGELLGAGLLDFLSTTTGVMREEEKMARFAGGGGPGPAQPPNFLGLEGAGERYASDSDWMPRLVLIAKNAHVWLEQLSRRYDQDIHRLDQIPDAELEKLARWGISGLWLIGLWQRSQASQTIKRRSGSPEAVSSAYSVYDYHISESLGGEDAYARLKERAWKFGVRLAADMVPNHMGITSKWVYEHPDWFLSLDHPPYPGYSFSGPNLSERDEVGIYLEDHYYDRTDAAVVFKRVDHHSGEERYIYHGNDGTSMPWNDTAQLDYLNAEAREAVIDQIVEVARKFPIIRFDAAMTLVKKHVQRLWYPPPGTGGAIPSRSERAMPEGEFHRRMPREFWIEVVERIEREAPDTLLLAEAFWMMEGYFVRSLGMHRVYNSAFMNMLRDEDNAGYRQVIKETLEFDPQILKRFVNFMNNPDEDTAISQFGEGDKYFGVATLMATMPGLPMLGHGQIEGFVEKYGMDFQAPRIDEQPKEWLIEEHRRRLFPLLHDRELFAEVDHFRLYDLYTPEGGVDENVFAYSNRRDDRRALVVYNNRYGDTRGWIKRSAAFKDKAADELVQTSLVDGLDLETGSDRFVVFRDRNADLEFIRPADRLAQQGIFVELGAYGLNVFMDFQEVRDTERTPYRKLCDRLDGRGVRSVADELRRMELAPIHDVFRAALKPEFLASMAHRAAGETETKATKEKTAKKATERADGGDRYHSTGRLLELVGERAMAIGATAHEMGELDDPKHYVADVEALVEAALALPVRQVGEATSGEATSGEVTNGEASDGELVVAPHAVDTPVDAGVLLAWALVQPLGEGARDLFDAWWLADVISQALVETGAEGPAVDQATALVRIGLGEAEWLGGLPTNGAASGELLDRLLDDPDVRRFLGVNRWDEVTWYRGEAFEPLVGWLVRFETVRRAATADQAPVDEAAEAAVEPLQALFAPLYEAHRQAEHKVDRLVELTRGEASEA